MGIEEILHSGEKIVEIFYPSRWAYFWYYLIGAILLPFYFIGAILILIAEILRKANKYVITTERVLHEYTFLSRSIRSAPYSKIQDIYLTQSLTERLVGIGTIHIDTAGTSEIEIKFKGVKNPFKVKKIIEEKRMKKW